MLTWWDFSKSAFTIWLVSLPVCMCIWVRIYICCACVLIWCSCWRSAFLVMVLSRRVHVCACEYTYTRWCLYICKFMFACVRKRVTDIYCTYNYGTREHTWIGRDTNWILEIWESQGTRHWHDFILVTICMASMPCAPAIFLIVFICQASVRVHL